MVTLTEENLGQGLRCLVQRDPDLAQVLSTYGPPPLWARPPGFSTLVLIILEQQVSLASARAAYERLQEAARPLTPQTFLALDDETLRKIGFSRQKSLYCRNLAKDLLTGGLDLETLSSMEDEAARQILLRVKGIGPWSADIYLLMALRRPDIWPVGDLALATAVREVKGLKNRPTPLELDAIGQAWRPWRAVAARLLWHHYLSRRGSA